MSKAAVWEIGPANYILFNATQIMSQHHKLRVANAAPTLQVTCWKCGGSITNYMLQIMLQDHNMLQKCDSAPSSIGKAEFVTKFKHKKPYSNLLQAEKSEPQIALHSQKTGACSVCPGYPKVRLEGKQRLVDPMNQTGKPNWVSQGYGGSRTWHCCLPMLTDAVFCEAHRCKSKKANSETSRSLFQDWYVIILSKMTSKKNMLISFRTTAKWQHYSEN